MSGWQLSDDGPTAYTRYAMPIMEPWTDDLLTQGQCKAGDRVLDIACGTGFVASRVNVVSNAECKVVGIDVNEVMLNTARKNTSIEWHLGSATKLPFDDGSFDVVLCQQGLQYFPDRPAAMREMARVLVAGGQSFAQRLGGSRPSSVSCRYRRWDCHLLWRRGEDRPGGYIDDAGLAAPLENHFLAAAR
jgi:SAM-dependent methyltransferase